jgi:hypothetical protein
MTPEHPLDQLPIIIIFLLTAGLMLLAIELGIRLGRYRQRLLEDKPPKDIALLVGATLTLLAFVLVFQVGTADQRYDNRRRLVVVDANAIGTAFLRAGYLEEPYRTDSRELYSEYVDVRLATAEGEMTVEEAGVRSGEIQAALWAQAEELARANPESEMISIYIQALNHMIDVHAERAVAIFARLPLGSLLWMFVLAFLTMGIIGYHSGLSGEHNLIAFAGLVLVFAAVIALIIDVDRPQEGLFQVSQQAMIDLQAMIAAQMP